MYGENGDRKLSRWDNFTSDELGELSSGLGWADNEGAGSDLMNKLDAEIIDILHKRNQTKHSQPNVEGKNNG